MEDWQHSFRWSPRRSGGRSGSAATLPRLAMVCLTWLPIVPVCTGSSVPRHCEAIGKVQTDDLPLTNQTAQAQDLITILTWAWLHWSS